jgi:putative pyruvate formate lyase activating enzyme
MEEKCLLCPHECGIDRTKYVGKCRASGNIKIALASIHHYEEPCISGPKGSGTVFFSHCNLNCIFCQNYKISSGGFGREISTNHLAQVFIKQQEKGVHNINLVSPTIYALQIKEAIKIAKEKGLTIPIIYNSSGYEKAETIRQLKGYVDIYMPDLKYVDNLLAEKYSNAPKYFEYATQSILEMYHQVGEPVFNEEGILQKGLIIRHLVLPNHIENTKKVLTWIKENLDSNVLVSVMAQYFPSFKAKENKELNRKLTKREYKKVEEYLYQMNLENGYIQELGNHEEEYVPNFDLSE